MLLDYFIYQFINTKHRILQAQIYLMKKKSLVHSKNVKKRIIGKILTDKLK